MVRYNSTWFIQFMKVYVILGTCGLLALIFCVGPAWRQARKRRQRSEKMLRVQLVKLIADMLIFVNSFCFYATPWDKVDPSLCQIFARVGPALYTLSNGCLYWFLLIRIELIWDKVKNLPSVRFYSLLRRALFLCTSGVPGFLILVPFVFGGEIIDLNPDELNTTLVCSLLIPSWISIAFALSHTFLSLGYTLFFFWCLEEINIQILGQSGDKMNNRPFKKALRTNLRRCAIAVSTTAINLVYLSVTEFFVDPARSETAVVRIVGALLTGMDIMVNVSILLKFNPDAWAPKWLRSSKIYHSSNMHSTSNVRSSTQ